MKKTALTLAHQIKQYFNTWSQAVKAAWVIAKLYFQREQQITFAKATGEVRTATAKAVTRLSTVAKGYVQFIEQLDADQTQWRSFRIERLIIK